MSSSNPNNRTAVVVLIAAVAMIGGLLAAAFLFSPQGTSMQAGTLLKSPRPLPEMQLVDENGAPFTRASLRGHWTLLFPGFTYCPDICPTTLALLKQVEQGLGKDAAEVQVLFFSVDPERDTPDVMKRYVHYFSPNFHAATVSEPALKEVAQALGVAYIKVEGDTPESYTMDHSAALVLINPDAEIAAYFTPPHSVEGLVHDLRQLLNTSTP
ncbi:MAG: SCO family protein [Nevskiales bacterium]|nr:SCO family protein [Nevskiales bacterium]